MRRNRTQLRGQLFTQRQYDKKVQFYNTTPWPLPKWVQFCKAMLDAGLVVYVYEAKSTHSKYVYVTCADTMQVVKCRFSNHKPTKRTQLSADSDFYVGIGHGTVLITEDLIPKVIDLFIPAVEDTIQ